MPTPSRFLLNRGRVAGALVMLLAFCLRAIASDRTVIDLSGPGWSLWLDRDAAWKDDTLHYPAPPIETLPVNPPSGGWESLEKGAVLVAVPGTVEEYLQKTPSPGGDLVGVSWWTRTLTLPQASGPRVVLLRFESIRQRAEVFINRRLAAYDVVGNSPLEVDISRLATPGERCEIAVRVTDPSGNFDWKDSQAMRWGKYSLPMSHGFGGITGGVRVILCAPVYIDDVYLQNTPAITDANAIVTVRNNTASSVKRTLDVRVTDRRDPSQVAFSTRLRDVELKPGTNEVTASISAPHARLWDVDNPNLYTCSVKLLEGETESDSDSRVFGFRWFNVHDVGGDATLRLNGKRIVLRTSISWGFWPINGMFPSDELAEKQVRVAKQFGLNMLNFHRAIGHPVILDKADELGLLYYEEPGAHKSVDRDPFGRSLAREKWLRMIRRDRSHPSLVIYNLINEWDSRNPNPDAQEIARHKDDLAAAHAIDPSRLVTHTSAWARGKDIEDPAKLHFRPFDPKPYWSGWYDVHHAGGPATWNDGMYRSPDDFYARTDNTREIVFWGEEGAISTPPRIALIKQALDASPRLGWDGPLYLDWHKEFASFLDRKGLRSAFSDVDRFTSAMGAVSLRHQGRRIENVRMSDVGDGYAVNGWEAEILENHSGIVDCFRNPKGDPAILAYYNQPLYVAVKLRGTIVHAPGTLVADFYVVNEKNLHGPHKLAITVRDQASQVVATAERKVTVTGGERYGELLATAVTLPVGGNVRGLLRVEAQLIAADGAEQAKGYDEALAVEWRSERLTGSGAVWESEQRVQPFLSEQLSVSAPAYSRALPRLDWVVVARGPGEGEPSRVPASRLMLPDGSGPGLRTTFFNDLRFTQRAHERTDPTLTYSVDDGAAPDPALAVMTNYGVRWEGRLNPERDGTHTFVVRSTGGVRLLIDEARVIDTTPPRSPEITRGTVVLKAGQPVRLTLELRQVRGGAQCELSWIVPDEDPAIAPSLLERVSKDGTTLVIVERAETWMPLVTGAANPAVTYTGSFAVGRTWMGGIHFVKEHPLFAGLPVNVAMDWPYQAVVRNGDERLGLLLEGEELAAGCYHSFPMKLGTVVGVVPFGKGRIFFSTLDLCSHLEGTDGPGEVARKLMVNYLKFAAGRQRTADGGL